MEGRRVSENAETPPDLPGLEMVSLAGEGGMSTVWKAFDRNRGKFVAVKVLKTEFTADSEELRLFKEEELAMERIDHPGIVKSFGMYTSGGKWYFVMEYVDGYNFASLLARKRHLGEGDCLLICESVASALDYAWNDHGIVHCDIKPANIMVDSSGVVKIADLGLCHTFACLAGGRRPVPDHVTGTPAYISPEQVYGDLEPDCRADIYSLGATLYHLSTGRLLFPRLDNEGSMKAHCSDVAQAKDPRLYRAELSEGFCQLLEAMLVKDRDMRVQTWKDVMEMCVEIERGTRFKPRDASSPSSLALSVLAGDD